VVFLYVLSSDVKIWLCQCFYCA